MLLAILSEEGYELLRDIPQYQEFIDREFEVFKDEETNHYRPINASKFIFFEPEDLIIL